MLSTLTRLVAKATNPHAEVSEQARHSLNSIPFERSENYTLFASKYDLHSVLVDGEQWEFYDTGPGRVAAPKIPLILIPGTTGTAEVFFQQLLTLGLRGYRLISVTIPNTSTVESFIKSLNRLLSYLDIAHFHLLGTSLGGYLSLSYTAKYPSRVLSLILTNSFISTRLFHDNAPYIPSEMMPEFYLRRYITAALPTHRQQSIQMALATDFVLKQVNSLCRNQLAARLSLNFSKHSIERIEYPQECITIIDTLDTAALDPGMRDALYALLHDARYSTMKYGGDFPYLANHQEYTMLVQVHLRRHFNAIEVGQHPAPSPMNTFHDEQTPRSHHIAETPTGSRTRTMSETKRDHKAVDGVGGQTNTKKKHDLPSNFGVFDHRRQYHNAQKAAIFRDDEHDQKDGVYYGSEHSSMSSDDGFDHHTEDDKRKSLMYSKGMLFEEQRQQQQEEPPRIMGIEPIQSHSGSHNEYSSEDIANGGHSGAFGSDQDGMQYGRSHHGDHHGTDRLDRLLDLDPFGVGNHTEFYTITNEEKRRYWEDRRIKKKRYKEYLARKKKAYKRHIQRQRKREVMEHKESGDATGDAADDEMEDNVVATTNPKRASSSKKKRRRKHKSKRKHRERGRSRNRKKRRGRSSRRRRRRKRSNDRHHGQRGYSKENKEKDERMAAVERQKEKMRVHHAQRKMEREMREHIMDSMVSVTGTTPRNVPPPLPGSRGRQRTVESAEASGYHQADRAESGMDLAAMGFGVDDLQRIRSTSTNSMISPVSVNTPLSLGGKRESQENVLSEQQDNDKIVEVGNDLISPRLEAVDADASSNEVQHATSSLITPRAPSHPRNNRSILEELEMHPIMEESSKATQQDPQSTVNLMQYEMNEEDDDDEELVEIPSKVREDKVRDEQSVDNNKGRKRPRASSRHRTVRESRRHMGMTSMEDDKDQTPLELAVAQSNHTKKPTTLGGHRYIPSYDSQMSQQGLTLDFSNMEPRERSSSYKPWNGNNRRKDGSNLSDLDNLHDINYEVSEIQDWPMEGTEENLMDMGYEAGRMSMMDSIDSNQPMIIAQRYRDDSVTPRAMHSLLPPTHHVVMESDDHVGDNIW